MTKSTNTYYELKNEYYYYEIDSQNYIHETDSISIDNFEQKINIAIEKDNYLIKNSLW